MSRQLSMFPPPSDPGRIPRPKQVALPGGCKIVVDGQPCVEPPTYGVRLPSCAACWAFGTSPCGGHQACTRHTAEIRADIYQSKLNGADVVPVRVSSVIAYPCASRASVAAPGTPAEDAT